MSWTLVTFDHKQPQWLQSLMQVYIKRIKFWIPFEHKILTPSGLSHSGQAQSIDWEKFESNKVLSKKKLVIFDENGSMPTSVKLSSLVAQWEVQKDVCFVIGPSYGLGPEWKKHASHVLSLSSLTLTHEFAQLIVTEQLYRAFTILKGLPYHVA
jgi:23S rRNA (pseudouridine1915-N3)-methyltransferase